MEGPMTTMIRQRITLSDQLSNNLHRPRKTLAAILEADKIREEAEEQSLRRPIRPSATTWTARSASTSSAGAGTVRVSLMTLIEMRVEEEGEADITREEEDDDDVEGGWGRGHVCCVCMAMKKGAAFIPCGHTFCRVCSREIFANRGNCPLCNALIAEVLFIF